MDDLINGEVECVIWILLEELCNNFEIVIALEPGLRVSLYK
jgi:hypothetical protein